MSVTVSMPLSVVVVLVFSLCLSLMISFSDYFRLLLSPEGFIPRAQCGVWTPGMVWWQAGWDWATFLSYLAIAIMLFMAYYRHREYGFISVTGPARLLAFIFGSFIIFCGVSHLVQGAAFFRPMYRLYGVVAPMMGIASIAAAIATPFLLRAVAQGFLTAHNEKMTVQQEVETLRARVREAETEVEANRQLLEQMRPEPNPTTDEQSKGVPNVNSGGV